MSDNVLPLAEGDVHMVILEDQTTSGWAGASVFGCPHCRKPIGLRIITEGMGRAVAFWLDRRLRADRQTVEPRR